MPMIIPNVSRSRRICTNSLSRIATKRVSENVSLILALTGGSLDVVLRGLHQADEHVLEGRLRLGERKPGAPTHGSKRLLERGRVVAGYVQCRSERDDRLDRGIGTQLAREQREVALVAFLPGGNDPRRQAGMRDHFRGRSRD